MRTGLLRYSLERWVDPADAFAALYTENDISFWLDSGADAQTGHSHMGASSRVLEVAAGSSDSDVFTVLAMDLAARRIPPPPERSAAYSAGAIGWVGWLGYGLKSTTLTVPARFTSRYPDAYLMFVDRCVSFDHRSGNVELVALGQSWNDELLLWRDETVEALSEARIAGLSARLVGRGSEEDGAAGDGAVDDGTAGDGAVDDGAVKNGAVENGTTLQSCVPHIGDAPTAKWRYTETEYLAMIGACQAAIVDGDAYQLCLTTEAEVAVSPDPLRTYLSLRASSPSHHGALIRAGSISLLSASPEQFVSVSPEGVIETKPIKGTRPRGATEIEDLALRAQLEGSDKERAENLMIVDLSRNDIARVSTIGSVTVPSLLAVESYAHVHQLVSTVRGQLAHGLSAVDAVASCFPAGSMTGAPKRSASQILETLEGRARGIYSGAFGVFGIDGSVDLAMVIRSIVIDPAGSTVGTGGGITALSVPHEEIEEFRLKAAALLRVLGVTA
ncbi:MAG: anthranilate synthase component I family protein [Microbacteriaceae bacterium]